MRLRLASFNTENLGDEGGENLPLGSRVAALRPLIERIEADILCLQEVSAKRRPGTGHAQPRSLAALDAVLAGTAYAGFHRAATLHPESGHLRDVHNLVILSRFPILATVQVQHDFVPPPHWQPLTAHPPASQPLAVTWERPLLHAVLDLAGRRLHVINLHLRAPLPANIEGGKSGAWRWNDTRAFAEGCFLAEMKRAGQAFEARLLIDRIFDEEPDALLAVTGDFNANSGEMPLKTIAAECVETGNAALDGRALHAISAEVPKPKRYSVLHGGEPLMLDHLLASKSLASAFRSAQILNEDLGDELFDWLWRRQTAGSHHAPVVAEFEL